NGDARQTRTNSARARTALSTPARQGGLMDARHGGTVMARQRSDITSKWLLHNQGKGVLHVGGIRGVRHTEPMPGELAQTRKYPDGLLRAFLQGDSEPHLILIEFATYPERRALDQALDDLALAYSALGQ